MHGVFVNVFVFKGLLYKKKKKRKRGSAVQEKKRKKKKTKKENRGSNIVPQLCHVSIVFLVFRVFHPLSIAYIYWDMVLSL